MNLSQPFRAEVERISTAVSDTFDALCAKINALWNIQHTPEGGHKDITASSLTVTKGTDAEVEAGTASGNVTADGAGPHTFGGNVIAQYGETQQTEIGSISSTSHGYNLAGGIEFISSTGRRWSWVANTLTGVHSCNLYDVSNAGISAEAIGVEVSSTTYYLAPGATATGILGSNTVPVRKWTAYLSQLFLGFNPEAVGAWATPTFAVGDYTAIGGAATWTVAAGDVALLRYTITDKVMTVAFAINTTTVGGGETQLRIKIPGGYTAAQTAYSGGLLYSDAGAPFVSGGNIFTAAGQTYIALEPGVLGVGAWTVSVNLTDVRGTFTFEVQ